MSRHSSILRMSAIALLIWPVALHAQTSAKASDNGAYAKALALREEAVALYAQPKRAAEAARLHVREARLRGPRDREAVEALIMAARLFSYANRPFDSRKTMEQAGDRAIAIGDVATAAHAYLDAAFIALNAREPAEVQRLGRKAFLLTDSPLLSLVERDQLRKRFKGEPSFAQIVK